MVYLCRLVMFGSFLLSLSLQLLGGVVWDVLSALERQLVLRRLGGWTDLRGDDGFYGGFPLAFHVGNDSLSCLSSSPRFDFDVFVFLLQLAMFQVVLQHLFHVDFLLLERMSLCLSLLLQGFLRFGRMSKLYFLGLQCILFRRSADECVVEGLFVVGHVIACMRVNIVSLQVISIDKTVALVVDILATVVFEALTIEVFAKGCVGQVS